MVVVDAISKIRSLLHSFDHTSNYSEFSDSDSLKSTRVCSFVQRWPGLGGEVMRCGYDCPKVSLS
jgi:hypothetical protein